MLRAYLHIRAEEQDKPRPVAGEADPLLSRMLRDAPADVRSRAGL